MLGSSRALRLVESGDFDGWGDDEEWPTDAGSDAGHGTYRDEQHGCWPTNAGWAAYDENQNGGCWPTDAGHVTDRNEQHGCCPTDDGWTPYDEQDSWRPMDAGQATYRDEQHGWWPTDAQGSAASGSWPGPQWSWELRARSGASAVSARGDPALGVRVKHSACACCAQRRWAAPEWYEAEAPRCAGEAHRLVDSSEAGSSPTVHAGERQSVTVGQHDRGLHFHIMYVLFVNLICTHAFVLPASSQARQPLEGAVPRRAAGVHS